MILHDDYKNPESSNYNDLGLDIIDVMWVWRSTLQISRLKGTRKFRLIWICICHTVYIYQKTVYIGVELVTVRSATVYTGSFFLNKKINCYLIKQAKTSGDTICVPGAPLLSAARGSSSAPCCTPSSSALKYRKKYFKGAFN